MADWEVDIGFNTAEMQRAMKEYNLGGGTPQGAGGKGGASTINTALMGTGIVGLLTSMKVILDVLAFSIGIVSSFLGFLVQKYPP